MLTVERVLFLGLCGDLGRGGRTRGLLDEVKKHACQRYIKHTKRRMVDGRPECFGCAKSLDEKCWKLNTLQYNGWKVGNCSNECGYFVDALMNTILDDGLLHFTVCKIYDTPYLTSKCIFSGLLNVITEFKFVSVDVGARRQIQYPFQRIPPIFKFQSHSNPTKIHL